MPKQFTLTKQERLKSQKAIDLLFKEGKSFFMPPLRVYFQLINAHEQTVKKTVLQFGVGVSSRNFKRAVDRNKIKRLMREAWRLQKNKLQELLVAQNKTLLLFFIFTNRSIPDYQTIAEKTSEVIKKLEKTIEPKTI